MKLHRDPDGCDAHDGHGAQGVQGRHDVHDWNAAYAANDAHRAHDAPGEHHRRALPRARRDLLGLAALLGPDSELVPISDLDGGAGCSSPDVAAAQRAPSASTLVQCGSCTTRCAVVALAHAHNPDSARTEDQP